MKIHLKEYRISKGDDVDFKKRATKVDAVFNSKAHYEKILAAHVAKLGALRVASLSGPPSLNRNT
jgi:hypothetical protein